MKVMIVGHTYTAAINRQKIREMAKQAEVLLLAPKKSTEDLLNVNTREKNSGFKLVLDDCYLNPAGKGHFILYKELARGIKKFKPDVIQVDAEPFFLSLLQASLAKPKNSKLVFFTWQNVYRKTFLHSLVNPIEKFNFGKSNLAIAGNKAGEKVLREKGYEKKIAILPQLGVDENRFKRKDASKLREKLGLKGFVVGFAGRFLEEKGLLLLLDALVQTGGNWNLLLVGKGPLEEKIREKAVELGITDKIIFQDSVKHEEIPNYLNCMDCFVLPSLSTKRWAEQFGHVLIEAMACETPVIGSNSGAIPEVVGNAGVIFEEGNSLRLSEVISKMMEDSTLRKSLAQKGRERVLAEFTNKRIAEKTLAIYKSIL
tara:strand:- start:1462 stop:2574 length:1113 start_codon:yes stop_codon:yes gene_type:complete